MAKQEKTTLENVITLIVGLIYLATMYYLVNSNVPIYGRRSNVPAASASTSQN